MRLGCAAYSYRDYLKEGGGMTLEAFIDEGARMGLNGVELTSYYFAAPVTEPRQTQRVETCDRADTPPVVDRSDPVSVRITGHLAPADRAEDGGGADLGSCPVRRVDPRHARAAGGAAVRERLDPAVHGLHLIHRGEDR